jgi:polysaccharide pyruvyl transferase WcaK-like protein
MMIALHGVHDGNIGSALMMQAAAEQRWASLSPHKMSVGYWAADYEFRAQLGLYQFAWSPRLKRFFHLPGRALPRKIRTKFGIVAEADVSGILDASGFALGDQWGLSKAKQYAWRFRRWRRQGKRVVMLPQAFGPFSDPRFHMPIHIVTESASLIFAREPASYEHLLSVLSAELHQKIQVAPDFTLTVCPQFLPGYASLHDRPCLIPNQRMLDRTDFETGKCYIEFFATALTRLQAAQCAPFLLLHEVCDRALAQRIVAHSDLDVPIVEEREPDIVKGIVGKCSFVVGSRYHGLVSALSQGVPAIGTSWSHKYEALFDEYGMRRFLISDREAYRAGAEMVGLFLDATQRAQISAQIRKHAQRVRSEVEQMWEAVAAAFSE